jgi:hypothetical protein
LRLLPTRRQRDEPRTARARCRQGGYEFNVTLIAVAFALAGVGPGEWSLDNVGGIDWTGTGWALIALGAGILCGIGAVIQGRAGSTSRAD